jgi:undecaprenyl-diphosphatase
VIARLSALRPPSPVLAWSFGALSAVLLAVYAAEAGSPGWEVAVVHFIQGLDIPGLHRLDLLLTRFGHTPWALPLTGLAVAALVAVGHPKLGLLLAVATVGRVVGGVIKVLIDRPRPDAGDVSLAHFFGGPSFPSGHVLGTTLLLGWLAYSAGHVFPQRAIRVPIQVGCVALIVMMGVSRIELGAHWPTDVLGGYLVAGLLLMPLMALHTRLESGRSPLLQPSFETAES